MSEIVSKSKLFRKICKKAIKQGKKIILINRKELITK